MISIKNLCVELNGFKVLNNLNLELESEESLVILGCSGTGKSVLLKTILGLLPIKSGSVIINNVDITKVNEKKRLSAIHSIGMLFQGAALFDSLPVWENIAFGLIYGHQIDVKKAKKIALEKMELVDLKPEVADFYPASLSGGMQKRVGLARALTMNPKIIFFDEPTSGLDPITSTIVNDLIAGFIKKEKIGAVTITHDVRCLEMVAQTVGIISGGKIVWKGNIEDVSTTKDPHIRQFLEASPVGPLTQEK